VEGEREKAAAASRLTLRPPCWITTRLVVVFPLVRSSFFSPFVVSRAAQIRISSASASRLRWRERERERERQKFGEQDRAEPCRASRRVRRHHHPVRSWMLCCTSHAPSRRSPKKTTQKENPSRRRRRAAVRRMPFIPSFLPLCRFATASFGRRFSAHACFASRPPPLHQDPATASPRIAPIVLSNMNAVLFRRRRHCRR
jgi:hypothetical protein